MSKLVLGFAMTWFGVFACVNEAPSEADPPEEATIESATQVCCADYECPVSGFETSGCLYGSPNIIQARQACNAACSVACTTTGTYCD